MHNEESIGNKYWILVPAVECKNIMTKYEEIWGKTSDFIRSSSNNSENYYER